MKVTGFLLAALFLFASTASANLYLWKDRDGVSHITDSMSNVPQEYRAKVKSYESRPAPAAPEQAEPEAPAAPEQGPGAEPTYNGHTEEWWRQHFRVRREQLDQLSAGIENKARFIQVFEAGRRFGQIFDANNVATYESYKKTLPKDREDFQKYTDELEKFKNDASKAGVPKKIIEGGD